MNGVKKPSPLRLRFSVPEDDVSVVEWIHRQQNLSWSLRLLIKESIAENGIMDVTCQSVLKQGKQGRPSKDVKVEAEKRLAALNAEMVSLQKQLSELDTADIQEIEAEIPVVSQPVSQVYEPAQVPVQTPVVQSVQQPVQQKPIAPVANDTASRASMMLEGLM